MSSIPDVEGERLWSTIRSVDSKVNGIDLRLAAVESSTRDIQQTVTTVKALLNHAFGKLALLVIGAAAAHLGIDRATEKQPPAPQVIIQKGSVQQAIEAGCSRESSLEARASCAARIAAEQTMLQR